MFKMKTTLEYDLLTALLSTPENLYVLSVWNMMSSINKNHAGEYIVTINVRRLPDSRHGKKGLHQTKNFIV